MKKIALGLIRIQLFIYYFCFVDDILILLKTQFCFLIFPAHIAFAIRSYFTQRLIRRFYFISSFLII